MQNMQRWIFNVISVCAVLLLAMSAAAQSSQVGKASYYGNNNHGRRTSSGSIYHKDSLTCAHRTYPFGTVLKVKDLMSEKEVYVKVTDRGPFVKNRVIDLSYAAAKELGMIARGIANVEITKVEKDGTVPYKLRGKFQMPQLEVKDPDGEGYCLLSKWVEKNREQEQRNMLARLDGDAKDKVGVNRLTGDSVPRWRIFDKLSAMSIIAAEKEFRYLVQ